MNPSSHESPEWEPLIQGFLENNLSQVEQEMLARILEDSPEAESAFVDACELHAMLESEPEIRSILGASLLPENVLPLDQSSLPRISSDVPVLNSPEKDVSKDPDSSHKKRRWIGSIAAAAVFGAFVYLALQETHSSSDSEPKEIAEGSSANDSKGKEESTDPETQYELASLKPLGSGSQERPPTNFSVEPSLSDGEISYNRDIRPILSDNCFSCHGPDEHGRKADLRLDTPEGATDPELATIVPGEPEASELVARILTDDEEDIMPPPETHKKLSSAQISLLTRWIEGGAEYEEHWAFLPIQRNKESETESIDALVDRILDKLGMTRSKQADPAILARRLYLDLIGLPPSPQQLDAFLTNQDPAAYSALVDALLAHRGFGEHRARYWLDAARYADTHGLHLDNYREIWPYRDWVIRAFNDNLPFDQFTIEQLAGDLLPDPTQNQYIATGFNRCNVTTSEGGSIEEEFLVRYAVDRVATTSTVWMGLTAGCAQCHDHKFDPITMKDFYSLFAFFNNTTQPGMDGNAKDSPPVVKVWDSSEQEKQASDLRSQIAKIKRKAEGAMKDFDPGQTGFGEIVPTFFDHGRKPEPSHLGDLGNFGKTDEFTVAFRYTLPRTNGRLVLAGRTDPNRKDRGWRVVWEDHSIFVELIEAYPGRMLKRGVTRRFKPGSSGHFAFRYDGSGTSAGIQIFLNGAVVASRFINEWFDTLETDFKVPQAPLLVGGSKDGEKMMPTVMEFVLRDRRITDAEMKALGELYAVRAAFKKDPEKRSDEENQQWKRFAAVFSEGQYRDSLAELAPLETELSRIESEVPTTLVMAEKEGEAKAHMLLRGEYDQRAEEVGAAFPAFLPTLDESLPKNRLGLAKWLVHPDHPLTARVTVNRIWQELFGVGLVKTSEDFGTQGENPSHPELLDFLAASLIESGWDIKKLYRDIVLSDTYRQSSAISKEMSQRDPENRLLARGPRFRLDAEVIRDQALHVSGLLDNTFGGMGVRPYQPAGIWKTVGYSNSNTQSFFQDYGAKAEHRRSIYTFWKRTAHSPNLAIFDAPNREICIMRRERTNTPLQALVMMNDPQFVRAARHLALRVVSEEEERDARIDRMATLLRGYPFSKEERQVVVNSFDQFRNIYESDSEAARQLLIDEVNTSFSIPPGEALNIPEFAAWTMVANQLLNLDEALNKN